MKTSFVSLLYLVLVLQVAVLPAWSEGTSEWLRVLNAQPGREQPLTEKDVVFYPAEPEGLPDFVAVGYPQSDGSQVLGTILWQGKAWPPLAAYAQVLQSSDFANKSEEERRQLFVSLLSAANLGLGIQPYDGERSREVNRPQPVALRSFSDGTDQFTVWFYEEASAREGSEWREVIYFVSPKADLVKARTVQTYHPLAEGLTDFPSMRK